MIDSIPPTSHVSSAQATGFHIVVRWVGQDNSGGSGIAAYDIYVSDNDGDYTLWMDDTTETIGTFTSPDGNCHTYRFFSVATDNVDQREEPPASADAEATVGGQDCIDQCPDDPYKTEPGECGCGVPDTDDDADQVAWCLDCDDNDPDDYPGNQESCDGKDNDCDGDVDEDFDSDLDGYTACGGDCDDSNADINPDAEDVCDGVDNDCDTIIDEEEIPPVITCPANVTLDCSADSSPSATGLAVATDNCGEAPVDFVDSHVPACGTTGVTTRTWTAVDNSGNSSSCTQTIAIVDTTAPTLNSAPADVTVGCSAIPGVEVVAATDDCDTEADVGFVETPSGGGCADGYTLTRTWTATDECGNFSTHVQTITVVNTPPIANADIDTTDEDTLLTIPASALTTNDSDGDGHALRVLAVAGGTDTHGSVTLDNEEVTYTPAPDFNGTAIFNYEIDDGNGGTDASTVTITVIPVNDLPVITVNQVDVIVNEGETATNSGTVSDVDGDSVTLSASVGAVVNNGDGTWSWSHSAADNDVQVVTISGDDGNGGSAQEEFDLIVNNVPPVVTVAPTTQTVQYSDVIAEVTITSTDVAADVLLTTPSWNVNGGAFSAGLPVGLTIADDGCTVVDLARSCVWTVSGTAGVPAGTYTVRVTVADEDSGQTNADVEIIVEPENATAAVDDGNPVAVAVASAGGDSGPFTLAASVVETQPDLPAGSGLLGDIGLAELTMTLVPVGPGGPMSGACSSDGVAGTGYDAVKSITCQFDAVPVNTYTVDVQVVGGYYVGADEDALVIYDPSLGFTTGGGWLYWPGTNERTNFGYTMKYNNQGQQVKGSLLLIRHLADGSIYRVKSNALYGLSLGDSVGGGEPFGWASFTGKSTYKEPDWPEPIGNHDFVVYVEDRAEPGAGNDRFWIEVTGGMSLPAPATDEAIIIGGGNIVVPH
jgi:hypothetical protein